MLMNRKTQYYTMSVVSKLIYRFNMNAMKILPGILQSKLISILKWIYKVKGTKTVSSIQFSSVQFSHSVMSDSLRSHEPEHTRPPCPPATARVYPNACPLSRWCHPTISSSIIIYKVKGTKTIKTQQKAKWEHLLC